MRQTAQMERELYDMSPHYKYRFILFRENSTEGLTTLCLKLGPLLCLARTGPAGFCSRADCGPQKYALIG
jgi:hypothetical protein